MDERSKDQCEPSTSGAMSPRCVVGLGEILWDIVPDGPRFGGAPANFACSVAGLTSDQTQVYMASSVGHDDFGKGAIEALREHRVETACVAVVTQGTGEVLVQLDDQGHANYEFKSDAAWDNFPWADNLQQLAARTDAVCFGTLGQRSKLSRQTIQKFVSRTPHQT